MIELKKDVRERVDQSVRIRTLVWLLLVVSLILSVALFLTAYRLFGTFDGLKDAYEDYKICQLAIRNFQDASMNLTNQMRSYVATGNRSHLELYFREVKSENREDAVRVLSERLEDEALLNEVQEAMKNSDKLMQVEIYAMRLALEGYGAQIAAEAPEAGEETPPETAESVLPLDTPTEWAPLTEKELAELPEELRNVELDPEDAALDHEEQWRKAFNMTFDENYANYRALIDRNTAIVPHLSQELESRVQYYKTEMDTIKGLTYGLIIVFFGAICLAFTIAFRLVILPLIRSTDLIERQRLLPVVGSREMRLLAANYNYMLEKQLAKQEALSYANDHDSLTGAYSRAVFDRFCQDPGEDVPVAMMLADLDYFKRINDALGHNVGDRVLKRAAELLMGSFRAGDLVCRIGGDEFAIVLFDVAPVQRTIIEEKLFYVEESLKHPGNGDDPPCSLSIGVVFGTARNAKELHVKADTAMYRAKKAGRGTAMFY